MNREEILNIIIDIYSEYKISELGFNLDELIKKMGINLIPYSCYHDTDLLEKYDKDGFNLINPLNSKAEIYYNDKIRPWRRIKFTLPHELGHICLGHNVCNSNESYQQEKDADIFANELYCPQAFLLFYKLTTISDLMSTFGITEGYARTLLCKLSSRSDKSLTQQEKRLVEIFENNKG